jgi:hypothetical protein
MPTLPLSRLLALATMLALAAACAHADCIADAAARQRVNAEVLRAIGWQESRLQPSALARNADGSIDVGAFQINSIHLVELARYGVDRAALADGCMSAEVAAWHYRRQIEREGDTWRAVGAYHSRTAARAAWYANRIATILMQWRVMPAGPLPYPPERARARDARRRPLPPAASAPAATPGPPSQAPPAAYDTLAFAPPAH